MDESGIGDSSDESGTKFQNIIQGSNVLHERRVVWQGESAPIDWGGGCDSGGLDAGSDSFFDLADLGFVATVEGPLADALATDQAGVGEDLEVFAGGGLRDAELAGDEDAADAVGDSIAVDLGREVAGRLAEPREDLKAA
jgi:hypothetical protein